MRFGSGVLFALVATAASVASFTVPTALVRNRHVAATCPSSTQLNVLTKERNMEAWHAWASATMDPNVIALYNNDPDCENSFGLYTPNDIPAGTGVMHVPAELILSSERISQELNSQFDLTRSITHLKTKRIGDQVPQFYLFVKFLQEYAIGDESQWRTWMLSLPRTFNTGVSMDDVEMGCLLPFAQAMAKIEKTNLQVFREALQHLPEGVFVDPAIVFNDEITEWCFNCVFSRCWGNTGDRCDIVPMGDMFNHNSEQNVEIAYDEYGNVNFYAAYDLPANTPLFMTYGKATNPYRLLIHFGFVDEYQPEIFCQIVTKQPTQELINMGYDTDTMVFRTEDGAISGAVWDVMLYSMLEQVPETQAAFYEAHMTGDDETKQEIHSRYHLEASVLLRNHLITIIQEIQAAKAKIEEAENDGQEHPRLPTIKQHTEFLHEAFYKTLLNIEEGIQQELARLKESDPEYKESGAEYQEA